MVSARRSRSPIRVTTTTAGFDVGDGESWPHDDSLDAVSTGDAAQLEPLHTPGTVRVPGGTARTHVPDPCTPLGTVLGTPSAAHWPSGAMLPMRVTEPPAKVSRA